MGARPRPVAVALLPAVELLGALAAVHACQPEYATASQRIYAEVKDGAFPSVHHFLRRILEAFPAQSVHRTAVMVAAERRPSNEYATSLWRDAAAFRAAFALLDMAQTSGDRDWRESDGSNRTVLACAPETCACSRRIEAEACPSA